MRRSEFDGKSYSLSPVSKNRWLCSSWLSFPFDHVSVNGLEMDEALLFWKVHFYTLRFFLQLLRFLRSLAHSNCVNFNRAPVLKPKNMWMSSSAQAKQLCVRFVCVCASWSTLPFIAVYNSFSRCVDHCFCSFRSLFESISIDYKTLHHWS